LTFPMHFSMTFLTFFSSFTVSQNRITDSVSP